MGSDTDDDSPCESIAAQPVLKPLLRTYRRRITIDEDWNVGDQNATTNSGIGVNLKEPSEPITKSSNTIDPATKEKLLKQNAVLLGRNAKLQKALTSKLLPQPEVPFKDVKGDFLDAETIRLISIEADTDYLFMKFLVMRLWPEGLTVVQLPGVGLIILRAAQNQSLQTPATIRNSQNQPTLSEPLRMPRSNKASPRKR